MRNIDSSGRQCFDWIIERLRLGPKIVVGDNYNRVFSNYQSYVGHYFWHLYNVVNFVDQSDEEVEAKKFYTDLIRGQLSNNELGILFCLGLSDRGSEFKGLVEKYGLFENITSDVLIDEEHRTLYAASAYGEMVYEDE